MKEYYTIDDIINLFPRCTTFMVRNYRYKTKIGLMIDGVVYYTADEVTKFIEDVEFENIARRTVMYEYIKHHPGVIGQSAYNAHIETTVIINAHLFEISKDLC